MITKELNINKFSSTILKKKIEEDLSILVQELINLKNINNGKLPYVKKEIGSSWCNNYSILYFTNGGETVVYSILGEYIIIFPLEYIITHKGNKYFFLIKKHTVKRYGERKLRKPQFNSVVKFILSFCRQNNKIILNREKSGVQSVSIRIRDGALLGYIYDIDPLLVRINTFISDKEIDEKNRRDQILLRWLKGKV